MPGHFRTLFINQDLNESLNYLSAFVTKLFHTKVWNMFKVNNKDTWHRSGVLIVNFLNYFTPRSSNSIVNFEYVIANWDELNMRFTSKLEVLYFQEV